MLMEMVDGKFVGLLVSQDCCPCAPSYPANSTLWTLPSSHWSSDCWRLASKFFVTLRNRSLVAACPGSTDGRNSYTTSCTSPQGTSSLSLSGFVLVKSW